MATSEPVVVSWKKEGLLFEGVTVHGHVDMASGLDEPGSGATPMELLAVALAGCTSMDVVSILQKMRQPLEGFRVEVRGEKADEHFDAEPLQRLAHLLEDGHHIHARA